MNKNEVILHGECMVFPSKIPATASRKNLLQNQNFVIVADSETTGNHHVVDVVDGVSFFEDSGGVLFMESEVPTTIRCVHADRHYVIEIPAGTYEFGSQQEYDPFTARLEKVRD